MSVDWNPTADYQTYRSYWGCLRKVPYKSRKLAKDSASKAARLYGGGLEPYRCQQCGQWHIATAKGAFKK